MSTEVAVREDQALERQHDGGLLESVLRAVHDPKMDPARLREFLEIGKELQAMEAKKAYAAAMSALQAELPVIQKNGQIVGKKATIKYARWDDIFKAVQPLLMKHGFAAKFTTDCPAQGRLTVTLTLTHSAGHSESSSWTLPSSGDNQYVTNLQNAASPISFGKRYVTCNMLNILTEAQDDDGTGKGVPDPITEEQLFKIMDIVHACAERESKFPTLFHRWLKEEFGKENPRELLQGDQLDRVMQKLRDKMARLGIE